MGENGSAGERSPRLRQQGWGRDAAHHRTGRAVAGSAWNPRIGGRLTCHGSRRDPAM